MNSTGNGNQGRKLSLEDLSMLDDWDWPPNAVDSLLGVLQDRAADESDRVLAAELAGSIVVMNDVVARALLTLVKDPHASARLRGAASIALGPTLEMMDTYDPDDRADAGEETVVSLATHQAIRDVLRATWLDPDAPKDVRRRVLEASVRGTAEWHSAAVRAAWHDDDVDWKLTAAFCMQFVDGFDPEIVEALGNADPRIRLEAVRAAGAHKVMDAWWHVRTILKDPEVDKLLMLAAIEAAGAIDYDEAAILLADLDVSDPDVAEAVHEVLSQDDALDDDFDEE